jgi:hypothetical protein
MKYTIFGGRQRTYRNNFCKVILLLQQNASLATNTSGALTTNRKPALSAANGFNGMKEESALGGIYDFNARYGVYPERSEGTPRSGGY